MERFKNFLEVLLLLGRFFLELLNALVHFFFLHGNLEAGQVLVNEDVIDQKIQNLFADLVTVGAVVADLGAVDGQLGYLLSVNGRGDGIGRRRWGNWSVRCKWIRRAGRCGRSCRTGLRRVADGRRALRRRRCACRGQGRHCRPARLRKHPRPRYHAEPQQQSPQGNRSTHLSPPCQFPLRQTSSGRWPAADCSEATGSRRDEVVARKSGKTNKPGRVLPGLMCRWSPLLHLLSLRIPVRGRRVGRRRNVPLPRTGRCCPWFAGPLKTGRTIGGVVP